MKEPWYRWALRTRLIDYWNFNCFLRPNFTRRYNLICSRTKRDATGLRLRRVRKFPNGLFYGVLPPFKEKAKSCAN